MSLLSRTLLLLSALAPVVCAQRGLVQPIQVQRKLALVIGNSDYPQAQLKNPVNDAVAMEATLKRLGFQVTLLRNADLRKMRAAIDDFASSLTPDSLGLFYFAGHGLQVNRVNYLVPVDFSATRQEDVPYEAYPADRVKDVLEGSHARLRILVLDACRNNPWRYSRAAGLDGLAPMEAGAVGTLIAYATGDNNTAADNPADMNGLYTKYLMPALMTPGLNLRDAFQKAKEDVYQASGRVQNPTIYENIVGQYYLVGGPPVSVAPATTALAPASAPRSSADADIWSRIKDSQNPEDFDSFAKAYPNSDYTPGAQMIAAQLRRNIVVAAPRVETPKATQPTTQIDITAGTTKVNPKDGLTYVWIPPGAFMMGCSERDGECYDSEKPAHQVTLTRGFWIGQTEVTQAAYQRVMGKNASEQKGPKLPTYGLRWADARAYCQAVDMDLPTEAEWEYAARGGNGSSGHEPLADIAWYKDNSGDMVHEVGLKKPNGFGLYDTQGNVSEWTADWYDAGYYQSSLRNDPAGPKVGQLRTARGGSWRAIANGVRLSARLAARPDSFISIGVRCAGK